MNKANLDRANVIIRRLDRLRLLKKDLSEGMHVFPVAIRARIPEKIQEECVELIEAKVNEEIATLAKEFSGL